MTTLNKKGQSNSALTITSDKKYSEKSIDYAVKIKNRINSGISKAGRGLKSVHPHSIVKLNAVTVNRKPEFKSDRSTVFDDYFSHHPLMKAGAR